MGGMWSFLPAQSWEPPRLADSGHYLQGYCGSSTPHQRHVMQTRTHSIGATLLMLSRMLLAVTARTEMRASVCAHGRMFVTDATAKCT
jgi:hypothetical protein